MNYVGKITNFEAIEVKPVVFEVGKTKVAIYFLGHIKEVKLSSLLAQKKITFKQTEDHYYKILCISQKREKEVVSLYKDDHKPSFPKLEVHRSDFPDMFNLILWGGMAEPGEGLEEHPNVKVFTPGNVSIHDFNKNDVACSHPG